MTLLQLQTAIYQKMQETSSNSAFSTTKLTAWINEALRKIASAGRDIFTYLEDRAVLTNVYTDLDGDTTAGQTPIAVTSASNMFDDQWLYIYTSALTEMIRIDDGSIDTTVGIDTDWPTQTAFDDEDVVVSNQMALPSDFYAVRSIRAEYISGGSLEIETLSQASKDDADRFDPRLESTGTPERYYIKNGYLYVMPLPDAAWRFILDYVKNETALSGDSDEPALPAIWHDLVIDYVMQTALLADVRAGAQDMLGLANQYMNKFNMGLMRMINYYRRQQTRHLTVKRTYDQDYNDVK